MRIEEGKRCAKCNPPGSGTIPHDPSGNPIPCDCVSQSTPDQPDNGPGAENAQMSPGTWREKTLADDLVARLRDLHRGLCYQGRNYSALREAIEELERASIEK